MKPKYITPKEIADELRISVSSATTLVRTGRIRGINVSAAVRPRWRVPVEEFERFKNAAPPAPPAPPPSDALPPHVRRFV